MHLGTNSGQKEGETQLDGQLGAEALDEQTVRSGPTSHVGYVSLSEMMKMQMTFVRTNFT